jgi:hypothetical protein
VLYLPIGRLENKGICSDKKLSENLFSIILTPASADEASAQVGCNVTALKSQIASLSCDL